MRGRNASKNKPTLARTVLMKVLEDALDRNDEEELRCWLFLFRKMESRAMKRNNSKDFERVLMSSGIEDDTEWNPRYIESDDLY